MGIVTEDIDRVRSATDFVALAAEHIALRRVGRQYQGLCPFHTEKSGSFSISPEKGVYYCFGCGAKGDAIDFVRNLEHLDFAAAVERLAAKAGISLRYDNEAMGRDRARKGELWKVMEKAVAFYHDQLLTSKAPGAGTARSYLRSRGYDGELVRRFQLGWAPDAWDTLSRELRLTGEIGRDTGLGFVNKAGKVNDFFRGRILFPIFDVAGQPVAFGGRKLPDADGPKYRNSPETPLYRKSEILYGLNWAKADIVATGEVIVCEGYTDVIAFHQAGAPRAVATCGTALADEHFKTLKNFARRIVLAYDADAAGQNAADKFYAWEKRYEVDLHVVELPKGTDPADVARTDPARLKQAVTEAHRFLAFRIERIVSGADLRSPEGRAQAFDAAAAAIWEHPNELVREDYLRQVADRCRVSEETLARRLSARPTSPSGPAGPSNGAHRGGKWESPGRGSGGNHRRSGGPGRAVANEPDDHGAPSGAGRAEGGPGTRDRGRVAAPTGRASSARTRGSAAATLSDRMELEVLRWAVHEPAALTPWPHATTFSNGGHAEIFECLSSTTDYSGALRMANERGDEQVVALLHRLAVEEPVHEALDVLAQLIKAATNRALTLLAQLPADHPDASLVGTLVQNRESLNDPEARAVALDVLVPWLESWGTRPIP